MLKIDERAWAKCRPSNFGELDFVALKTHEFLIMQKKLGNLDYNSNLSDVAHTVSSKVDMMMKDIALSSTRT